MISLINCNGCVSLDIFKILALKPVDIPWAFIAKTPLQSRLRLETHLVVMYTTPQCKLRSSFRNRKERNLHCDVVHVTTKIQNGSLWTRSGSRNRNDPDVAIKAYGIVPTYMHST